MNGTNDRGTVSGNGKFGKPAGRIGWRRAGRPSALPLSAAALGASAVLAAARPAPAALDYLYVPAGGSQATTMSAAPGASVSVNLYLQAQTTNGSTVLNNDGGLGTAGLAVTYLQNKGVSTPTTISGFALNTTDFTGPSQAATVTPTKVTGDDEGAPTTGGVKFGNTGGGTSPATPANEIFLATITFTAGGAGSSSVFNIGAVDATGGGYTLTNNHGYDVDLSQSTSPAYTGVGSNVSTLTLNVTPEPASLGFLAAAGLGLLARRRRPMWKGHF